ncbi:DUF803 domain membrane protein [Stagonosporopsis vannaccii]|nr:DUF803 domain membrane protein [Stagonosporopsis vannaccii]
MYLPAMLSRSATPTIPPAYTHNGFLRHLGQPGRYDENWSSLIGIVTAIVGNVLISFALNTQRYAHIKLDREWQEKERQRKRRIKSSTSISRLGEEGRKSTGRQDHGRHSTEHDPLLAEAEASPAPSDSSDADEGAFKQKSYLRSPYWWLGIVLMTIGEAGNFLAYGFAPASIVSPLGVVALISNCIIAPFMLKERFRWRDAAGVVVAVGGAVTVVLSASDNNPKLGPHEIWELIKRWEFETYLGITVGVIVVLMGASNRYGEKNILIDLGLVGLFGGFTALSTKGVASLLSYTLWRVITFPVFYLLVAILIGTAVMQIKYINRALQRFDATQVIPVQFVMFTLSVILGSAILYRDFERTSGDDAGKFVGGCALTFSGVWLITSGRPRRHVDDDDDEDEEDREPESDEAINLHGERYRDSIDSTSSSHSSSSTIRPASLPLDIIEINPLYQDEDRPSTPTIKLTTPDPATPPRRTYTSEALDSLIQNPWSHPPDRNTPSPKPSISRHTSTPVLPSEAAPPTVPVSSAAAHLGATPSDPNLASAPMPRTPTRGKSHDELPSTPGTSQSALGPGLRRLRTNERQRSIPGPLLASPLSTSLSALVQDLKRGGNVRMRTGETTADGRAEGRRQSVLGLSSVEANSDELFGEPLTRHSTQGVGAERASERPGGRGRGMSGTLNELWRGLRGQGSREDFSGEEGGGGGTGQRDEGAARS